MLVREVDHLREGGGEEQFLGQKEGRGLQRERSEGRKGGGLSLVGQNRIRMVRVFGSQGLLGGVRMRQRLR